MLPSSRRIRVLVVDDSAVVRKLVTDALHADPEIEVVGTAIDPYVARDKIQQLNPDVITLDLEMPRMDGLTFLRILMEQRPLPVIIMSSLTQRGSDYALEALRLGAMDVLAKPGGAYSFGDLGPQLIARIKAVAGAKVRSRAAVAARPAPSPTPAPAPAAPAPAGAAAPASPPAATPAPAPAPRPHPVATPPAARPRVVPAFRPRSSPGRSVILLGASTGGTEALRDVLTRLPDGLPGIAIVQHIPPVFSLNFANRLNQLCAFEVREAVDGDRLTPGLALVAPGNFHLLLVRQADHYSVRVVSGPPIWHQRPAVDLLFKSAADCGAAPHALAGVLTGMGRDGAEGLLRLHQLGATTFAQDEASSVVYGMPRAAWENGGAQQQIPLERIADHIIRHSESHSPAHPVAASSA